MAIPTFNGQSLFSKAAADLPGAIKVRVHTETMPGVDGEFVQPHGTGARQIAATGWLEGSGATPAAAHQALKTAIRTAQCWRMVRLWPHTLEPTVTATRHASWSHMSPRPKPRHRPAAEATAPSSLLKPLFARWCPDELHHSRRY